MKFETIEIYDDILFVQDYADFEAETCPCCGAQFLKVKTFPLRPGPKPFDYIAG